MTTSGLPTEEQQESARSHAENANGSGLSSLSVPQVYEALLQSPRLLAAASVLVERSKFASKYGLSFDGLRNIETALGYWKSSDLTPDLYRSFYERGDIAERLIETDPIDTWGDGVDIIEDPDASVETPFESAVISLFDRLDVWSVVIRADILAGLGHYAVILIGSDGQFTSELTKYSYSADIPNRLYYLKPLPEKRADIKSYVVDERDSRFGQPLLYEIDLGLPKGKVQTNWIPKRDVHWSRIIHIAEGGQRCVEWRPTNR